MATRFKPLIPAQLTDPSRLRYPLYLSPKVDGVRCSLHPHLGPVSRAGIQIPNPHLRTMLLDRRLHGLDGEIAVGPPNVPEVLVRTLPELFWGRRPATFSLFVFDDFTNPTLPFSQRIEAARERVQALALPWLHVLPQWRVTDARMLFRIYDRFLAEGYQGGVLRSPAGRYKTGQATEASQIAIKVKPEATAEAS